MNGATETRALHILNRLAYGPRPGELQSLSAGGEKAIGAWLESQLTPDTIADPALKLTLKGFQTLGMDSEAIGRKYKDLPFLLERDGLTGKANPADPAIESKYSDHLIVRVIEELQAQRLIRAVHGKAQLREVLFEFWWNHLNVYWKKIPVRWLITSYERDAIRPHLFGKYRDLLGASAHHPAMLEYLDNVANRANQSEGRGVNENYARELLELHTLGSDGGYSQKDVIELARILTGWAEGHLFQDPSFRFHEQWHDRGSKSLLGVQVSGNAAVKEGETALDLVARHHSTATFLSRKLVRFFVSDSPPEALVARIAKRFEDTDGNLLEVYRALFTSPEFNDRAQVAKKTKRPFQFVASAIRALGGIVTPKLTRHNSVERFLAEMGESSYLCASPTGYRDEARFWVNPGALVSRMNFSLLLAGGRLKGISVPTEESAARKPAAKELLEAEASRILGAPVSPQLRTVLGRLASNGSPLEQVRSLALASPEFQKR